ncbi:MAG: hypothetical protein RMJ87_03205 [Cytophagales bacterium]|nr:hypothetical protein [Bernardetiaceae bacterium]MDW8204015.1 hypothetical protein [Cytophagales bacterium]
MKIERIVLFTGLMLIICAGYAQLPKRGKPNIEPFRDEIARARKGNVDAMITVAAAYQGNMLTEDAYKDYKNALKWYQRALASSPTAEQQFEIKFNLFRLYFTGGYGIQPDLSLAKLYHAEAVALNPLPIVSSYAPNLHLQEFFQLYEQAQTGDIQAAIKAAMMSYQYGIHYPTAMHLLNMAANQPDAAYLVNRYEAELSKYRQTGNASLDRAQLFDILHRHARQGSMLAKTALLFEALTPSQFSGQRLKPEEAAALLDNIEQQWKAAYADEMQLKALCLLTKYQTGNNKILTLRRIAAVKTNLPSEELQFAKPLLEEWKNFERQAATIEGLAELQQKYALSGFTIDPNQWRAHFKGEVKALLHLKNELEKPVVQQLVGQANWEAYQEQLQKKAADVIKEAATPRLVINFHEELKRNTWLKTIRPSLEDAVKAKFSMLGIDSTNMPFFYAQSTIEDTKFSNIHEARMFISNLLNALPQPFVILRNTSKTEKARLEELNRKIIAEQARLSSFAKVKIIRDLLGEAPSVEQIERAKPMLLYESWLQPEGEKMFFHYTSDSPNWFSGDIRRGNVFYYYKVTRIGTSNRFRLEIQAVANDKSNLVFNSIVRTNFSPDGVYEVDILGSRMTGYAWNISENDYLTCIFRQNQQTIDLQPFGYIARCLDRNHGYHYDFPRQKVSSHDFSERNAVRSAVRAFILEYHNALKPL